MFPPLRLWVIVERKKLLSPCQTIRPVCCQPPLCSTVSCVSTSQSSPSAARSCPRKFTGPAAVVALAASSSKSFVGIVSCPFETVGAIGPLVGVPPLRVWRSQRPSSGPSNSSEREYSHAPMTENRTLWISDTLPARSLARNSTNLKPASANASCSSAVSSSPSRSVLVHSCSWLTRYSIEAIGENTSAASIVSVAGEL
jgi:hypothetical protein